MAGVAPLPPPTARNKATASLDSLTPALYLNCIDAVPSHWQLPEADIHNCITFSRMRCVLSLVSLLLLLTDIPRTGLGVRNVFQFFPNKAGPNVAVYFGPWAYPVAHIWRNGTGNSSGSVSTPASDAAAVSFGAKKGDSPIKTTTVWSYEYDSTSIGMRGVAQLLNVSALPQPSHAITATFELKNTWTNLDMLVSAIHHSISKQDRRGSSIAASAFDQPLIGYFSVATVHLWVDRLHHYLYRFMHTTTRWRMHTIHAYAKTSMRSTEALSICSTKRRHRPLFCDMAVEWLCKHPENASLPKVPIWDHIDLRAAELQRKYPDLLLDLTVLTTFNPSTSTASVLSAYFESEVLELVTLFRGRSCAGASANTSTGAALASACVTVFVDDYRYERGVLEANIVEWYPFTATLRAVAQCYVWVRIALLLHVAYASEHARLSRLARLAHALRTMSKIPFQVVVYGSLAPVLAYVLAHVIDCGFVDLYLEMYWTTIDGSLHLDLRTLARHAAMQMRNVWILALAMKALAFMQTRVLSTWRPASGVCGVRGLAISLSSALSVFGPYRSLAFRDSSVIAVLALATSDRGAHAMESVKARPIRLFNVSVEGLPKDMKMTALAVAAVLCVAVAVKALLKLLRPGHVGGGAFGHSTLVPYSAGLLWSTTALSVRFSVSLKSARSSVAAVVSRSPSSWRRIAPATTSSSPSPVSCFDSASPSKHQITELTRTSHARRVTRYVAQLAVSACHTWLGIDRAAEAQFAAERRSVHDVALRLEERSIEINSLVRLMNIAMMTDPWTLFRLRVLGRQVFFYEPTARLVPPSRSLVGLVTPASLSSSPIADADNTAARPHVTRVFVLPCSAEQLLEWTGYSADELRLVGQMNSRDLPWTVLLQCG